ncbi:MAG: M20/M25/M40 family metallo-hydrolase [Bacteroidota bacterium]
MSRFHFEKILFVFLFISQFSYGQDTIYARKIIDLLSSASFSGRGYVNKGDSLAANYIANEYKTMGLKSFSKNYIQPFSFPINTFPGEISFKTDQKSLEAGKDFMVSASSNSIKGEFEVVYLKKGNIKSASSIEKFISRQANNRFVVIDKRNFKKKEHLEYIDALKQNNSLKAKGYIQINDGHLYWSVSNGRKTGDCPYIIVSREKFPKKTKKVEVEIESRFYNKYPTQNVVSWIEGAVQPDTFLVFTGHYDHLGRMGKDVYFPGANDNASGTAMLLNLAKHFSNATEKPYYSIAFMNFTGEEAGLLGSKYYTENPLFPLKSIKFLFNLDMVGTGKEGITVVNATAFENEFKRLTSLNDTLTMFPLIKKRAEAANSDHYFFYKKGVPCFFIYSFGGSPAYHDVYDVSEAIDLRGFEKLTKLMIKYVRDVSPLKPKP